MDGKRLYGKSNLEKLTEALETAQAEEFAEHLLQQHREKNTKDSQQ